MNTNQQHAIELIQLRMIQRNSHGSISYEVKSIDSTDIGDGVSVAISIGLVDETEGARAFLREHRHFFIGKLGGIELVSVDAFNRFESLNGRVKGLQKSISYLPKV